MICHGICHGHDSSLPPGLWNPLPVRPCDGEGGRGGGGVIRRQNTALAAQALPWAGLGPTALAEKRLISLSRRGLRAAPPPPGSATPPARGGVPPPRGSARRARLLAPRVASPLREAPPPRAPFSARSKETFLRPPNVFLILYVYVVS